MLKFILKIGSELTFANHIIGDSGRIIFEKGDKVIITEVIIKPASVGKRSGIYYPEQIEAVRIEGLIGVWYSGAFVEPFL